MSCVKGKGRKYAQIVHLWNLLLIADPKGMVDIRYSQIAHVVDCTEEYARSVWLQLMRGGK